MSQNPQNPINTLQNPINTLQNPIKVIAYGKGNEKVDFAFTGEPPIFVFSFIDRSLYYPETKRITVCDFTHVMRGNNLSSILTTIKTYIDEIKDRVQSGTIIVDRITDFSNYITKVDRGMGTLPRTSILIDEFLAKLMETDLDIVMLAGERKGWDYTLNQPSDIVFPDIPRDLYHAVNCIAHVYSNGDIKIDKMSPSIKPVTDPTIPKLKDIYNSKE